VFVDVKRCFSLFLAIYEVLFHLRFSGFFFFVLVYGVSTMESSGENFVNFVWNEKSYSSQKKKKLFQMYIYLSLHCILTYLYKLIRRFRVLVSFPTFLSITIRINLPTTMKIKNK
jgi:cytochrome b561